jgi:branched-chain amino acid transport system substrate-binding protein
VIWANPVEGAFIVRQMKELKMDQLIAGFDRMSHPLFLEYAGEAAEGVVVASTMNPTRLDPEWTGFRERYRNRFQEEPDVYAAHGYDAMWIIIHTIRRSGLNRVRIRDQLYRLETYAGVTGSIIFDQTMNDVGRPWLAVVENGSFNYFHPADWPRVKNFPVQLESEVR